MPRKLKARTVEKFDGWRFRCRDLGDLEAKCHPLTYGGNSELVGRVLVLGRRRGCYIQKMRDSRGLQGSQATPPPVVELRGHMPDQ